MKKFLAALLSTAFLFSVSACNNVEASIQNTESNTAPVEVVTDFTAEAQKNMEDATEVTLNCTFGDMTGIYAGETKNGIPHGKGKFVSQNKNQSGWFYEGDFVDGHFEGTGKTVFQNGQIQQGAYVKDIWHPNTIQFFEFMQTLPGSNFTINEKARSIFTAQTNYFPVESTKAVSSLMDNKISYQDILKNPQNYGDKFMSVSDLAVSSCSTFSITENPESLPELRGAYIESSNAKGENYALYYRGNIEGLKEDSIIESAVGIPLGVMQKTDDAGEQKSYVILAVSYLSLQQTEVE